MLGNQFQDKVSIIAGGTSGIGRALGEELAQRGARISILDNDTTYKEISK